MILVIRTINILLFKPKNQKQGDYNNMEIINTIKNTCCICGNEFDGKGNDPTPITPVRTKDGIINVCCDDCNYNVVMPTRRTAEQENRIV